MIRAFRLVVYFLVGLVFGAASVYAFAVPGVASSTGAWRNPGASPSWSGGSGGSVGGVVSTIETVKIGGTHIPVPAVGTITGTAVAATMVSALRASPQAFLGGLLIQWLANQGMEWIDGEWKKLQASAMQPPTGGTGWTIDYSSPSADTPEGACHSWINSHYYVQGTCTPNGLTEGSAMTSQGFHWENGKGNYGEMFARNPQATCPPGSTFNNELQMCEVPGGYQPAGQSDWDQVAGVTPPDAVMNDICGRLFALDGIGCRVTNLGTKTAVAPISDSYTDGTGTNWSQTAKWTPAPTASNPLAGDITIIKAATTPNSTVTNQDGTTTTTDVDPNTGKITTTTTDPVTGATTTTVTDPATGSKTTTSTSNGQTETKTEAEEKEFCLLHPDSLACSEYGEVEPEDLETDDRTITITPDTGFGPLSGSCPADLVTMLHNGVEARFSWSPLCTMANTFRPIVIGMAWVAAGLLMFGLGRRGE